MTPRVQPGFTVAVSCLEGSALPARARLVYDWLLTTFCTPKVIPDLVSARTITGLKKDWWTPFDEKVRRKVDKTDFAKLENLSLERTQSGYDPNALSFPEMKWAFRFSGRKDYSIRIQCSKLYMRPDDCGFETRDALAIAEQFAVMAMKDYANCFCAMDTLGASSVASGAGYGHSDYADSPEQADEYSNGGFWPLYGSVSSPHTLLRNIYRTNFLTSKYLSLPVEGKTLERWVKSGKGKWGELEVLNDRVTAWRVEPEQIPIVRERFFRSGHLYYYRFFRTWEKDNSWARDFGKPFKCPDEIPAIFRADYRQATDY